MRICFRAQPPGTAFSRGDLCNPPRAPLPRPPATSISNLCKIALPKLLTRCSISKHSKESISVEQELSGALSDEISSERARHTRCVTAHWRASLPQTSEFIALAAIGASRSLSRSLRSFVKRVALGELSRSVAQASPPVSFFSCGGRLIYDAVSSAVLRRGLRKAQCSRGFPRGAASATALGLSACGASALRRRVRADRSDERIKRSDEMR